ncbi:MAG TPA: hypothetical protein VD928_03210 [Candidatus Paceibacterota bacterium]|nr:hypothetical protein [Candidatus Paceibacterota bacterium]
MHFLIDEDMLRWLPPVSESELERRVHAIKPVMKFKQVNNEWKAGLKGTLYYILEHGPNEGFMHTAAPIHEATDLVQIGDVQVFHRYKVINWFDPSLVEILAQIPQTLAILAAAFEVIYFPRGHRDFEEQVEFLNQGYHQAFIRLYGHKR